MAPPQSMDDDDIVTLLLDDHARVRRLFAELDAAGDCPARLSALWEELAGILLAHLEAAKEICYLPLFDAVLDTSLTVDELSAHKEDACQAVVEARLHEPGSPMWWLAVRAARDAAGRHFRSVESGPLPDLRRIPEQTRRALARQWKRYLSDLVHDSPTKKNMSSYDYFSESG